MRGSSDLDAWWESSITVSKRKDGQHQIQAEHREAEPSPSILYQQHFDRTTDSVRLTVVEGSLRAAIAAYRADHPDASANRASPRSHGAPVLRTR